MTALLTTPRHLRPDFNWTHVILFHLRGAYAVGSLVAACSPTCRRCVQQQHGKRRHSTATTATAWSATATTTATTTAPAAPPAAAAGSHARRYGKRQLIQPREWFRYDWWDSDMDLGSRCVVAQHHVRGWTRELRKPVEPCFAPADVPQRGQQHNVSLSLHFALDQFHVRNGRRDRCSAVGVQHRG